MRKKLFILLAGLILSTVTQAQEETSEDTEPVSKATLGRSIKSWGVQVSSIQWNQPLKIQENITIDSDVANYSGMTLGLHREITYLRWGWSFGGFIGSGRANGGGNSSLITYEKSKVPFTVFGIAPRAFYRLSGRINTGVSALVFMKNAEWPKDSTSQSIDSGRNLNVMPVVDLNIRLFQKWDFYSGIGPLAEGATFWRIGANYRF